MLLIIKANINGTIADILIDENGKYKEISENITASGGTKVIEANSMMACPTFVNTHMHFDKAYTSELWQKELDLQGINVITAQDTICDGFHLYGTGDPLDYGLVGCYCAQYNTPETARIMWDMLTSRSARAFDPDAKYGIQIGNDADLNIVDAPSVHGAIRIRASHPYILRRGKVIAGFERKAAML